MTTHRLAAILAADVVGFQISFNPRPRTVAIDGPISLTAGGAFLLPR